MHAPKFNVNDDKAWSVPIRAGLAAKAHRTTGHAAEMAFFAVLTLVPSTVAVGSALGLSEGLIGTGTVAKAEDASVEAVSTLMGPELADKVIAPFVHAQLAQPRGGVAVARPADRVVALEPPVHVDRPRARPRLPRRSTGARPWSSASSRSRSR